MRIFPALLVACLLAGSVPAATGSAGSPASPDSPASPASPASPSDPVADDDRDPRGQQTSDGVQGEIARQLPRWYRGPTELGIRNQWRVAPGVKATIWDETSARGPVRSYLLSVDLRTKGLRVDYTNGGPVRRTSALTAMLTNKNDVGGVNGDFFDIGDTGAPLGIGKDRQRGALNGPISGWNNAFFIDSKGRPQIDVLPMMPVVKGRPEIVVTNVNSPTVRVGGIGAYNQAWGRTVGYRIVDGQQRDVRRVLIREGKVVRNTTKLTTDKPIDGVMLVGRGPGAKALSTLEVGEPARVRWHLEGTPNMAITGNKFLVRDGVIKVVDDRELHPRTAIGIDRETKTLLFLVVDGRQSFSRGYTMVELANRMIDLGADEALNLDGGGSSTWVARGSAGKLKVRNSPSDGGERSIANGIEILYKKPAAAN